MACEALALFGLFAVGFSCGWMARGKVRQETRQGPRLASIGKKEKP